ncbi:hypothetical protein NVV94_17690 [Pseudomonas sp. LS1212]|uniref:hypothetical protein n=1 Tax=Pseudomonas sp. LS1212 TaxID=2972478 RepID=UPI00215D0276|nr:hypothetical protein [Pseudomonas sp. LS1212]UVJ42456.1 hypothetical protein NVV94_17690 [Pseudomonas sp. LS1212]
MSDSKAALACSEDLWQLLNEVNLCHGLSYDELEVLQDTADSRLDSLVRQYGGQQALEQFQHDCRCMAKSMQTSCQTLRLATLNPEERGRIWDAFQYQMAYLQACLQRSFEQPMKP